jgi:hypothetical protein
MLKEAARAAVGGDSGDDGDKRDEAARRPPAMCNPHARARTVAMADRDIDSPRIPRYIKKGGGGRNNLSFSFVPAEAD